MKIIISPAKQMKVDMDTFDVQSQPVMLDQATEIMNYLRGLSLSDLKKVWHTSDRLFDLNLKRLDQMDLTGPNQSPAILAFTGLQYQYMSPDLFTQNALDYLQQNVRILSSFYGVLRPFDGIIPYRLEMKAKVHVNGTRNLHDFWNQRWADQLTKDDDLIINLASKMYAQQVERYLNKTSARMVSCIFGMYNEEKQKVIQDNTYAKMARGEMVRYMAENQITDYHEIIHFNDFGYQFSPKYSDENSFVFLRQREERGIK